jgi:hypothetical protein
MRRHTDSIATYDNGFFLEPIKYCPTEFNKKFYKGESLRYAPTRVNGVSVQATWQTAIFTLPSTQGSAEGQRVGDEVALRGLEFYNSTFYETVVTPQPVSVRLVIVQVKNATAALAVTDVFDTGTDGVNFDITSMFRPFSKDKAFEVLYDKVYVANPYGNAGVLYDKNKLKGAMTKITFFPNSTNLLSPGFYQYFLVSDSAAAPHPTFWMVSYLWYNSV